MLLFGLFLCKDLYKSFQKCIKPDLWYWHSHKETIEVYYSMDIGMMVRVFANSPGDLGSIPGWVILKGSKNGTCLMLSIIRYELRVKWSNPGKGVAPSPSPWCSSYRKGSLWVALNYGRQLYYLRVLLHSINKRLLTSKETIINISSVAFIIHCFISLKLTGRGEHRYHLSDIIIRKNDKLFDLDIKVNK